ncbi:hypothetical protein BDZ89DRAFT_1070393 [Hymenopellis radicata]|nr:hypothetical protein BDZ89DRAFT_1070393 [Hymenopellis radicata]
MTPPNATPPASERKEFNRLDIEQLASSFAKFAKVCHNTARATFYAIFILEILSILDFTLTWASPPDSCEMHITWPFLVSWAILVGGASLRVHCYHIMSQYFTFELCIRKDHRLITYGPYAYVRHPSYTGAILAALGSVWCALLPGSWLGAALIPRMRKEDNMLREAFSEEWDNWRKRVPYRLIPRVY